jgi:hypothetical protein
MSRGPLRCHTVIYLGHGSERSEWVDDKTDAGGIGIRKAEWFQLACD